jgi:hypothetical protein
MMRTFAIAVVAVYFSGGAFAVAAYSLGDRAVALF